MPSVPIKLAAALISLALPLSGCGSDRPSTIEAGPPASVVADARTEHADIIRDNGRRAQWYRGVAATTTSTSTTVITAPPTTVMRTSSTSMTINDLQPQYHADLNAWCYLGCIPPQSPCVIPAHICSREARFVDQANNGWRNGHTACGKYQFIRSTWAGHAGYGTACLAPEAVQDAKASALWDHGRGCGHWAAC